MKQYKVKTVVTFMNLVEARSKEEALRKVRDQDSEGLQYNFPNLDSPEDVSTVVEWESEQERLRVCETYYTSLLHPSDDIPVPVDILAARARVKLAPIKAVDDIGTVWKPGVWYTVNVGLDDTVEVTA